MEKGGRWVNARDCEVGKEHQGGPGLMMGFLSSTRFAGGAVVRWYCCGEWCYIVASVLHTHVSLSLFVPDREACNPHLMVR